MGLIRKSLFLGSAMTGVPMVRWNSSAEKAAKKSIAEMRRQTEELRAQSVAARRVAAAVEQPVPPPVPVTPPVPVLPPAGWVLDQHRPGLLRWWDGTQWTEHVRPVDNGYTGT